MHIIIFIKISDESLHLELTYTTFSIYKNGLIVHCFSDIKQFQFSMCCKGDALLEDSAVSEPCGLSMCFGSMVFGVDSCKLRPVVSMGKAQDATVPSKQHIKYTDRAR